MCPGLILVSWEIKGVLPKYAFIMPVANINHTKS